VREPFAGNDDFWRSVGSCVDASVGVAVATTLTLTLGPLAAITFLVPVGLLAHAAVTGRRSARCTQARFATRNEWRGAERQAVAAVLLRAYTRPRRRHHA
jgi:hypothetical protein